MPSRHQNIFQHYVPLWDSASYGMSPARSNINSGRMALQAYWNFHSPHSLHFLYHDVDDYTFLGGNHGLGVDLSFRFLCCILSLFFFVPLMGWAWTHGGVTTHALPLTSIVFTGFWSQFLCHSCSRASLIGCLAAEHTLPRLCSHSLVARSCVWHSVSRPFCRRSDFSPASQ